MGRLSKLPAHQTELAKEMAVRERAEGALRESENRLRTIIETQPECVKVVAKDGRLLEMNAAGLAMLEATSLEQVQKQSLLDFVVPEFRAAFQSLLQRIFKGETGTLEFRVAGLKGARRWLETTAAPLRDESGKITALLGITRDITERKRAEAALRESEANFRTLFEQAAVGVAQIETITGRFARVNRRYCEIVGYTEEEMQRLTFQEITHPEDLQADLDNMARLHRGEIRDFSMEKRYFRKDGAIVWVNLTVSAPWNFGGTSAFHTAVIEDITERKKSEALLYGQKQVLEMIATDAPLAATLTALVRVIEEQSSEMLCTVLLLDPDGTHLRHGAAPRLPEAYVRAIDGMAIGANAGSCGTAAFRREPVIVEDIASDPLWADYRELALAHGLRACWSTPIFDLRQDVLGTFAIYYRQPGGPTVLHHRCIDLATDLAAVAITRQRAEVALRASEANYRTLVESASDGIFVGDAQGRCKDVNAAGCRIMGYTREELLTMSIPDFLAPEEIRRGVPQVARLDPGEVVHNEWQLRRKDGTVFPGEASATHLPDGRVLAILRDITERREAEESLRRISRRLLRAEDEERRRIAKELHDSTAQDLVATMMNLDSLRDALRPLEAKPGEILQDTIALVENCAHDIRTLSYLLHPPLLDEMGLPGGLAEYAAGLDKRADIRISVEAAPDFGRLPEELERALFRVAQESLGNVVRHSESKAAKIRLARTLSGIVLEIEDYGRGMRPEVASQPGTGGVGIAGMRERLEYLGGRLEIESSSRGATVRALLPLKEERK